MPPTIETLGHDFCSCSNFCVGSASSSWKEETYQKILQQDTHLRKISASGSLHQNPFRNIVQDLCRRSCASGSFWGALVQTTFRAINWHDPCRLRTQEVTLRLRDIPIVVAVQVIYRNLQLSLRHARLRKRMPCPAR